MYFPSRYFAKIFPLIKETLHVKCLGQCQGLVLSQLYFPFRENRFYIIYYIDYI